MKITNKKAYFDYEILESFEVGVVLKGSEVKSIRQGRINLKDAYVKIINDELWLVNADIPRYEYTVDVNYKEKSIK
jgi:SsrA-binding protein